MIKLKQLLNLTPIALVAALAAGCSQGIDAVSIKQNVQAQPKSYTYISNTNLQGLSASAPTSSSYKLPAHRAGGTTVDAKSSSTSYRMTGGVVIR